MNNNIIGVLAGMGPRSTAPFLDLLMDECQNQYNAKNDIDFPHIIAYSLPTPFYVDRPINHNIMKQTIITALCYLEKIGVNFIAMPCNSAHIYFDELKSSINIPLLNIIDETIKNLDKKSQRVTLFATPSTYESKLYQKGLNDNGYEFVFKDNWQITINTIIKKIKLNKYDVDIFKLWEILIEDVKKESIDSVIIACTDLNALLENKDYKLNLIDSSKCLANTTISKYLELNPYS